MKKDKQHWNYVIETMSYCKDTREALKKCVDTLIDSHVPVILNIPHLSEIVNIKTKIIYNIIYSADSFYYRFSIPKRSGKPREINSPFPVLLHLQKWIYENILQTDTLHSSATGFVLGKSIIDNARLHLKNNVLLKMDIKDFFPSISKKRIISVFNYYGYPTELSYNLASICCLDDGLPQGAPTSPVLSNIIAKRLDNRLLKLSEKLSLTYSRYADDLTFSGNILLPKVIEYVTNIIEDEGFKANIGKTKLIKGKKKKIVTGISISNGKMTIPKVMKREIRKDVHFILKLGLLEHMKTKPYFDPIYVERLIGKLNFWKFVEPDNQYVMNSLKKLTLYSKKLDNIKY